MLLRSGASRSGLFQGKTVVVDESRKLIHELKDKHTVLLSSHLLTEVQVIADEIVMIGRGRIVAQGTTTDLVGARGTRVGAVDAAALDALATALRARDLDVTSSAGVLLVNAAPEVIGAVALEERVVLTELSAGGAGSLEEMFLELTAATSREGAAA